MRLNVTVDLRIALPCLFFLIVLWVSQSEKYFLAIVEFSKRRELLGTSKSGCDPGHSNTQFTSKPVDDALRNSYQSNFSLGANNIPVQSDFRLAPEPSNLSDVSQLTGKEENLHSTAGFLRQRRSYLNSGALLYSTEGHSHVPSEDLEDEKLAPFTRWVQTTIYKLHHPSDCSNAEYLVSTGNHSHESYRRRENITMTLAEWQDTGQASAPIST